MARFRLQPWQARRLYRAIHPCLGYLYRLGRRMEKVGITPSDPLLKLVRRAYDAMHALSIELHYRSCDGGTGRPTTDDAADPKS